MEGLGQIVTRTAHIVHGRSIYLIAGIAPADQFRAADREFAGTIQSFRTLTSAEAGSIRPNRVDLYTVRNNDTWQSLSARNGGVVKPATLAIMNDYDPREAPRPGDRIKIVVRSAREIGVYNRGRWPGASACGRYGEPSPLLPPQASPAPPTSI